MLSLDTSQLAAVAATTKAVSWLFSVRDAYLTQYYWSTKSVSFGGQAYTFKIISFDGITLARPKTEMGVMAPSTLNFSISNKDAVISPDDLEDGTVTITLVINDASIASWKFLIKKASAAYQSIEIQCEDFFQQYIEGNYPVIQLALDDSAIEWIAGVSWDTGIDWYAGGGATSTTDGLKVRDVFPSASGDIADDCCIPLPFGTCYIPLRSTYITDDRFYVIGPMTQNGSVLTYTISKVRTPRAYSTKVEYESGSYDFNQHTKTSTSGQKFRTFQAMVAAGPAAAFYPLGDNYYDLPTCFSRSDMATMTNPADIIKWVLEDMGIASADINTASFTTAGTTFDGWNHVFNGAFWHVISREQALTSLLAQCHATLVCTDQVYMKVLTVTSQKTLTAGDIMRTGETGVGTYKHSKLERTLADSGNVSYSPASDSQDLGVNALVQAKSSSRNIDSQVFEMMFVSDSTIAVNLAKLYFQRKLLKKATETFTGKATLIALQPSDFITLPSGYNYGGAHDVIIDSMKINKDVSIDFTCTSFSEALEDYPT
jgi:hypothetical protein